MRIRLQQRTTSQASANSLLSGIFCCTTSPALGSVGLLGGIVACWLVGVAGVLGSEKEESESKTESNISKSASEKSESE